MSEPTETTPTPEPLPPDCEHQEWQLGCERCFAEMRMLAKSNINSDEVLGNMMLEGASLFAWYVVNVILDMQLRLEEIMNSTLDLRKRELATSVIANLHNLSKVLVSISQDPVRMQSALKIAADFAEATKTAMQPTPDKAPDTPTAPAGIILTD